MQFGFMPMPEEMRQALEAQSERQEMEHAAIRAEITNFFLGASKENLMTMRKLFRSFQGDSPRLYEGIVSGILVNKFAVCLFCDEDHDSELAAQFEAAVLANGESDIERQVHEYRINPHAEHSAELLQAIAALPIEPPKDLLDRELMVKWGLDDAYADGTNEFLGYQCINCKNTIYPSIQSRMLKPQGVEGCEGCINKAKWG